MFLILSFLALPLCLLPINKYQLVSLVYGLFFISYLSRPEIGSDYEAYLQIYNFNAESDSLVFDNILHLCNFLHLPYRYLGIIPLTTALFPFFIFRLNYSYPILFSLSVFYSFFNICSVCISKSSLCLSIFAGIVLPLFTSFLVEYQSKQRIFSFKHILLFFFLFFAFLIHPALTGSLIAYPLFAFAIWFLVFSLPKIISNLRFKSIYLLIFAISFPLVFYGIRTLLYDTSRYTYYFLDVSSHNFTVSAGGFVHALPFLLFSLASFFGIFDPLFYPSQSYFSFLLSRFKIALPMLSIAATYLFISNLGLNANIIGRTSIIYSFCAVLTIYIVKLRFSNQYPFGLFTVSNLFYIKLLLLTPLFYRAISSYRFVVSIQ